MRNGVVAVQGREDEVTREGGLHARGRSVVRISPTRITSGSWRRIDFSPVAKVSPACSLVWIWLILEKANSTGSSIVMTLRERSLTSARVA